MGMIYNKNMNVNMNVFKEKNWEGFYVTIVEKVFLNDSQKILNIISNIINYDYCCELGDCETTQLEKLFLDISFDQKIKIKRILFLHEKIIEFYDTIKRFEKLEPSTELNGEYDLPQELFVKDILTKFENIIEVFKLIYPNVKKTIIDDIEMINDFNGKNVFMQVNFLRKMIIHPENVKMKNEIFLIVNQFTTTHWSDGIVVRINFEIFDRKREEIKNEFIEINFISVFSKISKKFMSDSNWIVEFEDIIKS